MRYVFDIEANGFLKVVTKVHSLVLKDIDTKEVHSYADQPGYRPVSEGVKRLKDAKMLIGHNIICYDIPVLEKVLNFIPSIGCVLRDTLLMSRIRWPEINVIDKASTKYMMPGNLFGDYSLEAFTWRLGSKPKVQNEDWSQWTPNMQNRCESDVEINFLLWEGIQKNPIADKCLEIETEFQKYIHVQETNGVPFDTGAAHRLNDPLVKRIEEIKNEVWGIIPPWEIKLKTKVKYERFNPGSRPQIIRYLSQKYNWKPEHFTDKGNPELSGDVLDSLPFPEAKLFASYFEVQKLVGMLSSGRNSWLNFVQNGRIHGRVITTGAITRRCTHSSPNLAQIPSVRSFLGKEVRELFYAPAGYNMVGADAAGLELRCLSHYLARYDDGAYGREVIDGDVHTVNQLAVELDTRDKAKTFIYAFIYGAGDETLGEIFVPAGTAEQKKAAGAKARRMFGDRIPAYRELSSSLRSHLTTNDTIKGIDGGTLLVRQKYSALNTLLQNAGSVAVKQATVFSWREATKRGIEFYPALHVHDEWQSITKDTDSEEHGKIKVQAIKDAGEDLGFRIPLDGEYKIGKNWAETH